MKEIIFSLVIALIIAYDEWQILQEIAVEEQN